jgi:hypothetical protein
MFAIFLVYDGVTKKRWPCAMNPRKPPKGTVSPLAAGMFSKFAFPLIRQVMPNLIANQLVSVQPMSMPISKMFSMGYTFKDPAILGAHIEHYQIMLWIVELMKGPIDFKFRIKVHKNTEQYQLICRSWPNVAIVEIEDNRIMADYMRVVMHPGMDSDIEYLMDNITDKVSAPSEKQKKPYGIMHAISSDIAFLEDPDCFEVIAKSIVTALSIVDANPHRTKLANA